MQKLLLLFAGFMLALTATAQIAIDGRYESTTETDYQLQAAFTGGNTGFGDWGILELRTHTDTEHLYVNILGTPEANFNKVALFIDVVSTTTGVDAGVQLPAPNGGFWTGQPTLDIPNTDYLITYGGGNGPYEGYVDIYEYANGAGNYLGGFGPDGGAGVPLTDGSSPFAGMRVAYTLANNLSDRNGPEAVELEIDLADLGITTMSDINLMAAYTSGDGSFFSANTLPEIAGQAGTNLGNNPDFTVIGGDQFVTIASSVLPVDFSIFTATAAGKTVVLDWATSYEEDNAGFRVERSADGAHFTDLGWVAARPAGRDGSTYRFTDTDARVGTTYFYRLRQEDHDGAFAYSATVSARLRAGGVGVVLAPNPVERGATQRLFYDADAAGTRTIELIDAAGRPLGQRTVRVSAGRNVVDLPTAPVSGGTYLLRITGGEETNTVRFMVR